VKLTPFRVTFLILSLTLSSALAAAQTPAPSREPPREDATSAPREGAAVVQNGSTTASEDFVLDIGVRRITERDYEASTEVSSTGDEGSGRGLDLRVGVMVRASSIDVLLRNVRGRVRFRANLDPVLRLLNLRRVEPPAATTTTTTPAPRTNPSP
jgi:hypothetical protein